MDHELRSIANLIRQRQPADARHALGQYLKAHPDSAEAWFMLSMVAAHADQRLRAAQKAAALDSSSAKYGERLARLLIENPRSGRRWRLLAVPVLLMLIAIGAVWAAGQISQPEVTLPTQAAFEPQAPAIVIAANELPDETAQPSPALESPAPTNTAAQIASTPSATQISIAVIQSATVPTLLVMPTDTASPIPPTAAQTASATITNTVTPTAPAIANPTSAAPLIPTTNAEDAIPLLEAADIGTGQMLVLDAMRRASAAILDRGGSAPPAPAGQEWVLVELMLICDGEQNCSPETGALNLTGNSGQTYPPAAGFQLEPVFGPDAFLAGQVWGYLGFIVPDHESSLWLVFGQGSAVYRFALQ